MLVIALETSEDE